MYYLEYSRYLNLPILFWRDQYKNEVDVIKEVEKVAEREMKLFEFELFYSLLLQNKETAAWVKEKRKEDWEKALKEADGDWEKAMTTFAS